MELSKVRPKKELGQHFLTDNGIASRIAHSADDLPLDRMIEIGPGMGILTKPLLEIWNDKLALVEIDAESVNWLKNQEWLGKTEVISGDFLKLPAETLFSKGNNGVIGNYPYNISTQIAFRVLESSSRIVFFGGMFQKEVAVRVAEKPGSKEYGITSVLLQAFYDIHYCFTVDEHVFSPPPKVKSGVIRCTRNNRDRLKCDEKLFFQVVKMAFNQRRKTLRNSLKQLLKAQELPDKFQQERPEQLSVTDFEELTLFIQSIRE
jgi:16S rRNA (adenine1518-N6/adenine1519-N6)-dimethyltransferase